MRSLAFSFLPLLLAATAAPASSQSFTYRYGGNPHGITFFGSRGWVAEDGGRIRYTDDGGDTWTQAVVDAGVRGQLRSIQFVSSSIGFSAGDGGALLKSTDGGANWTLLDTILEPVSGELATLHQVYFHDEDDGWVMGNDQTIYHTLNGGADWTQVHPPMFHDGDVYDIAFPDPTNRDLFVLALDWGILDWTDDGGESFEQFRFDPCDEGACPPADPELAEPCNLELWSVDFYDEDHGLAVGGVGVNAGYILRTTDGGLSWTNENCMELVCSSPPCEIVPTFYGTLATGTDTGITVGYASSVLRRTSSLSPNGVCDPCQPSGVGWEQTNTPGYTNPPQHWIASAGTDTAMATGVFGALREITNGGATITQKGTLEWHRIFGGRFADASNGFLVGQNRVILRTGDGGASVDLVDGPFLVAPGISNNMNAVGIDGDEVIAAGDRGNVRYSGDGGDNWGSASGQRTTNFRSVCFAPSGDFAVAVGDAGVIDKSTNGGQSWSALATLSPNLYDVQFVSNSTGIVVGAGKYAAFTTNGGTSWTSITVGGSGSPAVRAVATDGTTVYAVGDGGSVWKLVSGELQLQSLGAVATTLGLFDVALVPGTDDVIVTGDQGLVLYYDGSTWTAPKSYMGARLVSVDMFSASSGMIVGLQTGVLRVE